MLHTLTMISRARGSAVPRLIVPTMYDRRTRAAGEALQTLRERYGDEVWSGVIPVDTQFREASKAGRPLSLWQPRARGAVAYRSLTDCLLERPSSLPDEEILAGQAWA